MFCLCFFFSFFFVTYVRINSRACGVWLNPRVASRWTHTHITKQKSTHTRMDPSPASDSMNFLLGFSSAPTPKPLNNFEAEINLEGDFFRMIAWYHTHPVVRTIEVSRAACKDGFRGTEQPNPHPRDTSDELV